MRLAGDARAPGVARTFVEQQLSETTHDRALADDVVLVVSELVTNAVRAGASTIHVTLDATAHRVVLVVDDDASGWPTLMDADNDAVGGRGLSIVEQLADEWHVSRHVGGKRVTARWNRRGERG
jgi:anti-sigma regulatory factor (Ser/Thr protein kinase)